MFVRLALLSLSTGLLVQVPAQQDPVTVDVAPITQEETLALWVTDVVEDDYPSVRVRSVKVCLDSGAPVIGRPSSDELVEFGLLLRDESVYFRVFHADGRVGIFKYRRLPRSEGPKRRGLWLRAQPLDRDTTFLDMTRDARESADIEALLEMDIADAEQAARREKLLDRKIADAIEREWEVLNSGSAFLVATRPSTRTE